MGQVRLNHLMILSIYIELLDELDLGMIANEFVRESEHRQRVFGNFNKLPINSSLLNLVSKKYYAFCEIYNAIFTTFGSGEVVKRYTRVYSASASACAYLARSRSSRVRVDMTSS